MLAWRTKEFPVVDNVERSNEISLQGRSICITTAFLSSEDIHYTYRSSMMLLFESIMCSAVDNVIGARSLQWLANCKRPLATLLQHDRTSMHTEFTMARMC